MTDQTHIDAAVSPAPTDQEFGQYRPPALPSVAPPWGLSVMRPDSDLSLCDPTVVRFSRAERPRVWAMKCDPAFDAASRVAKCSKAYWDESTFRPFEFYDLSDAPCVDPVVDPQEYSNRIVSEHTAWAVTAALDYGLGSSTTTLRNAIQDPAFDLTPGVAATVDAAGVATNTDPGQAVSPMMAVTMLIQAMVKHSVGQLSVNIPPWALPAMRNLITFRGGIGRLDGEIPVNIGMGFTGVGPEATGLVDRVNEGEVYIYAHRGLANYRLSEIGQYDAAGTMIHEDTNTSMAEGLRQGKVVFDAGCVYAIRVDLQKGCCS